MLLGYNIVWKLLNVKLNKLLHDTNLLYVVPEKKLIIKWNY